MMDNPQGQPNPETVTPEKIFGKYENLEEAQKGYFNAVSEMNKTKEQLGMALSYIEKMQPQGQPQPPTQKPDYVAELERYGVPTSAIEKLVEQRAKEIANGVVQQYLTPLASGSSAREQMAEAYEDFAQNEKKIISFVKADPVLKQRFDELLENNRPYDALELGYFHWAKQKPVKPAEETDKTKRAAGMPPTNGGQGRLPENFQVDKLQRLDAAQKVFEESKDYMPLLTEVLGDQPLTWSEQMARFGRTQ